MEDGRPVGRSPVPAGLGAEARNNLGAVVTAEQALHQPSQPSAIGLRAEAVGFSVAQTEQRIKS